MANRTSLAPSSVEVSSAATSDPVTLSELKAHLRISHSDDDALLLTAISEATDALELATRRHFINATIVERFDDWPLSVTESVALARAPVSAVDSITYVDTAGVTQTWAASNYSLDQYNEPARIEVEWDKTVPANRDEQNSVAITYTCGYGASASDVPLIAKRAILLYAGEIYDNRCSAPQQLPGWNQMVSQLTWSM